MNCPACKTRPRGRGKYLCPGCWYTLPPATRKALNCHDDQAVGRLVTLQDALADGTPLRDIAIT